MSRHRRTISARRYTYQSRLNVEVTVPSNADFDPRDATLWRDSADGQVTADASGAAVDFAAGFYAAADGADPVDVSDAWVYSFVIDNCGNDEAIQYRWGSNTYNGTDASWRTIPAGQLREFAPFWTGTTITVRRTSTDQAVPVYVVYKP